jgi:hypothetical protein
MDRPSNMRRMIAAALFSGGVAVVGMGLGAGVARRVP